MGQLLSGIDLCFNPSQKGSPDGEGHYTLGFGLIQRSSESQPWSKVNGFSESAGRNTDFLITLYDLSGQLTQIDFVTVAWRPDSDSTTPASDDSPFSSHDFDEMIRGKVLHSGGNTASCGCGSGGSSADGNMFSFGQYTMKNSGAFEVTIEARVTYGGQTIEFKCDPKIIVGS